MVLLGLESEDRAGEPVDDIRDVSDDVDAMMFGPDRLASMPLSLRLLREMRAHRLQCGHY